MKYGFCNLALVPMRKEPYNVSEQVNQLLFGETFDVIESTNDKCLIKTHHDSYRGWISQKQFIYIDKDELEKLTTTSNLLSARLLTTITQTDLRNGHIDYIPLALGSPICYYNYTIGDYAFSINRNDAIQVRNGDFGFAVEMAKTFLNAPYQWGGRSILGIDCSGFTQLCYRFAGINLQRDASQQGKQGKPVENATAGDLCFFSQPQHERITHVGIYTEEGKIIHASGRVRIDYLCAEGIEDFQNNVLTHRLLHIRNFASELV